MVHDVALRVGPAASSTRVPTFLVYARFIAGTFLADGAFGAAEWRTPDVIRDTRTNRSSFLDLANRIGAARRRIARVARDLRFFVNN